jgi:hypothetical protein
MSTSRSCAFGSTRASVSQRALARQVGKWRQVVPMAIWYETSTWRSSARMKRSSVLLQPVFEQLSTRLIVTPQRALPDLVLGGRSHE